MPGCSGGFGSRGGDGDKGTVSSSSVEMVELQSEATVKLESGRPENNEILENVKIILVQVSLISKYYPGSISTGFHKLTLG
jgi:hypothetical protein